MKFLALVIALTCAVVALSCYQGPQAVSTVWQIRQTRAP